MFRNDLLYVIKNGLVGLVFMNKLELEKSHGIWMDKKMYIPILSINENDEEVITTFHLYMTSLYIVMQSWNTISYLILLFLQFSLLC